MISQLLSNPRAHFQGDAWRQNDLERCSLCESYWIFLGCIPSLSQTSSALYSHYSGHVIKHHQAGSKFFCVPMGKPFQTAPSQYLSRWSQFNQLSRWWVTRAHSWSGTSSTIFWYACVLYFPGRTEQGASLTSSVAWRNITQILSRGSLTPWRKDKRYARSNCEWQARLHPNHMRSLHGWGGATCFL